MLLDHKFSKQSKSAIRQGRYRPSTEHYKNIRRRLKVLVIGLGQLGLPVAKYVKDRGGFDTFGYDISTKAMDRAQKIAGIKRIGDNSTGIGGIRIIIIIIIITIMPHMILLNLMSLSSVFLHTSQMTCFLHK